jgi:hypothetical protein
LDESISKKKVKKGLLDDGINDREKELFIQYGG